MSRLVDAGPLENTKQKDAVWSGELSVLLRMKALAYRRAQVEFFKKKK